MVGVGFLEWGKAMLMIGAIHGGKIGSSNKDRCIDGGRVYSSPSNNGIYCVRPWIALL